MDVSSTHGSQSRGTLPMLRTLMQLAALSMAALGAPLAVADDAGRSSVIVVVGAGGTAEYGRRFQEWADRWVEAARTADARVHRIGPPQSADVADRERLRDALRDESKGQEGDVWLVLIGHGTFDGQTARFNLRDSDVTPADLTEWLAPVRRPVAVIDCSAASSPFLPALSHPDRVVVAATRSGFEQNFTRFGDHLSAAMSDTEADLDKDGQTSLLEAFLIASRKTAEFYDTEGRLATEHALIDDNGDALGTPADWFRGVRAVRRARDGAALDGYRAHQLHLIRSEAERNMPPAWRARRDRLELEVIQLRDRKSDFAEDDYYIRLEPLLLDLARLYEQMDTDAATRGR